MILGLELLREELRKNSAEVIFINDELMIGVEKLNNYCI